MGRVRAKAFRESRMKKYLAYLERMLQHGKTGYLVGSSATYADLAAFQIVEGLSYAYPKAMKRLAGDISQLLAHHDRIAARPKLAAYLASPRRLPFNQQGLFRHYAELDE